jgi:spore maturation protein SpmA
MVLHAQFTQKVDSGFIWIATVLLFGILLLGWGYLGASRIGFYAGLMLTLAGVFTGILKILFPQDDAPIREQTELNSKKKEG